MYAGTDTAYELARKYNIKTAWGIAFKKKAAVSRCCLPTPFDG